MLEDLFDALEARWQTLVGSTWANRWLPEVRYLRGWNLREVALLLLIGLLTSSWYKIHTDRQRHERQLKHEEEHAKQWKAREEQKQEEQDEKDSKEQQQVLEEHGGGLLARVVSKRLFSPAVKKKKKPDGDDDEEENHKKAHARWTSPSFLDIDHRRLLSVAKPDLAASLGFSVGKSWERRYQTLAMFSCSLYFVMPGTYASFALVLHFGFFMPYHVFVSGDLTPDDQYVSFFEGILPDWYHGAWVGLVAASTWAYLVWYIFLDDSPNTGSRKPWIRDSFGGWWNHACDFLPVVLVKTADLPAYNDDDDDDETSGGDSGGSTSKPGGSPSEKSTGKTPNRYVLGYHPHGIIAVGAFCAFATDGVRVLDLSPKKSKSRGSGDGDSDTGSESGSEQRTMTLTQSFLSLLNSSGTSPLPPDDLDDLDDDDDDDDDDETSELFTEKLGPPPPPARGFSTLFPSLDRRIVTLPINFRTPLLREYLLAMGAVTSEKQTFRRYLGGQNKSGQFAHPSLLGPRAMVVVVGGAAESMVAHEGQIQLILKQRRGFVREAIMAGASLVPVLGFGETNLYHLYEDSAGEEGGATDNNNNNTAPSKTSSVVSAVQNFVRKNFGVAVPLFSGRSVFLKSLGLMPQRRPVVVVVGKPIRPPTLEELDVDSHHDFRPRIDTKTDEASNPHGRILIEWHSKYVKALEELYAEYKDAPWNGPGKRRQHSMKILR